VTPDYRFALRPRWLLLHVAAVVALALMIAACSWQLSRLQDKQRRNALYADRSAQPVEPVEAVVAVDAGPDRLDDARFRLLEARGRYLVDEEVFVRSRSLDGRPGAWVLTPLLLDGAGGGPTGAGVAVVVNRGWIPSVDTTPELPVGAEAPPGPVVVTGLVLPGEQRSSLGAVDTEGVDLQILARVDLGRLQQQVDPTLLGVYLQLQGQQPAPGGSLPVVVPPPPPDEGPHRSYAGQWAIFALIWVVGYPLLVRRAALRRAADAAAAADTAAGAGTGSGRA
jgi:cytochrome oxidase assembly protein ShyY1